ncbi:MAG TPA: alpha/beta hydrolase [Lachnospiraceae bacterium]|nr:alpha/beta hydrolase [Lachnospiraceae bacterium]
MAKISVDRQIKSFVKDHISRQDRLDEKEKMSPLMQAIKAVHSVASAGDSLSEEDLKKQRAGQELFSKLATPPIGVSSKALSFKNIRCEWTSPDFGHDTRHIILYCHGGGYTCGSINYARILASKLAIHTGLSVFSFEYRLAPENPYPAAVEDAMQVWDYLMHQGYGAGNTVIAGDSAGGNLALEVCLRLKREERLLPAGLVLMSPWTDMTMSGASYEECLSIDPMLTPAYIRTCMKAYLPEGAEAGAPEFSPLFGSFEDFPPVLIQVGTNEILRSDSELLSGRLTESGVFSVLEVYEDSWHVFQQMPLKRASRALDSAGRFIQRIL